MAVLAAFVVGFALVAWSLWQRAAGLQQPAYDTAFFEQVVWNVGHGGGFVSGFFPANFLGLHFSPLLALPAVLELAWPDARLLGLLHAAALALSAPAAYLLFSALLEGRAGRIVAAALAAPLPFWLVLQRAALAGFHSESLGLPLALVAGWAGLRGRWLMCWVCAVAALLAREDLAYAVAVIGLLLAFHGPVRAQGAALAVVAVVFGAMVELALMPALRASVPSDLASYYSWLPHAGPGAVIAALANPAGWLAFAAMVASLAGLPILRPAWLALALPPFAADLLSAHFPQPLLHLQYGLPLVVPVLVAGGLGAQRLLRSPRLQRRPAALAGLALPALVIGVLFGPLALQRSAVSPPALGRLSACASQLPGSASLASDDPAAAALAARSVERPLTWVRSGDWVLVDRQGPQPTYVNAGARDAHLAALPRQGRRLYCDDGRFQLWGPARA